MALSPTAPARLPRAASPDASAPEGPQVGPGDAPGGAPGSGSGGGSRGAPQDGLQDSLPLGGGASRAGALGGRLRVLFPADAIAARNASLAAEIAAAKPRDLLVVAVLKGSFMFAADLIRALHETGLEPRVEFIHLSSYRAATVSSGQVEILRDIDSDVRGRDVLLVDDILESGRTLAFAKDLIAARGAGRVMSCVLLEKPNKRAVAIDADFVGFRCPDVFVVGYGMDVAHAFRQLPFVGFVDGA